MRRFRDRLQDILDAIKQIEAEQAKGKAAFDDSPLMQVWMVHHLMIIGEAVRAIDPALKGRNSRYRSADILVNACQASKWKSGRIAQLVASMPSNDHA